MFSMASERVCPWEMHPGREGTSATNTPSSSCWMRTRYFMQASIAGSALGLVTAGTVRAVRVRTATISLYTDPRKSGGGGGGIRTREGCDALPVFKTGALSQALPPLREQHDGCRPVSYTHLTLPTIYSV